MSSDAVNTSEPQPIEACTVSRVVENFDLLIEDMEIVMGEQWGDLSFDNALTFLSQNEARSLKFLAIAVDSEDEEKLPTIEQIIGSAKNQGIKVILIARDLSPSSLHQLLRSGGDEFIPYPLPDGELAKAIERVTTAPAVDMRPTPASTPGEGDLAVADTGHDHNGVVIAIQGLSGGTGASTLAANLACELAQVTKTTPPRVCVIDLDLQTGSVASFLDVPQRSAVIELLSDTEAMDGEAFLQALTPLESGAYVLAAPEELLPLDFIGPADVERIIAVAKQKFDYVIIDMPHALVDWTETVLSSCQLYFAMLESDLRSAQNCLRFRKALTAEDLPVDKLRFVLNRAPKFTDLNGRSRVKSMTESLKLSVEVMLPDGGKLVTQAADQGDPLLTALPKNPLRKEIAKLAIELHKLGSGQIVAA